MDSKLTNLIRRKISEANLNPNRASTPLELPGGLKIAIRKNQHFGFKVYLSRPGLKPPSETEIKTILEKWPGKKPIAYNYETIIKFEVISKED